MEQQNNDRHISIKEAQRDFPGASIDKADDNDVTAAEVKQATELLDNNPRSHDM